MVLDKKKRLVESSGGVVRSWSVHNHTPKISVLMPAWNSEKYIGEAIDSILAQTFKDFEFIIINDGSTDNTAEIVRRYKDPRIVFIDNKQNQGLIAVLNQGMDLCRGEYIARMDSDDISLPERFAKQIAYMDANSDVAVLGTSFQEFGDKHYTCVRNGACGLYDIARGCKISHPTVMLRKSVFDKYNFRYSEDYEACEDYELWSRVALHASIANLPAVLLKYRCHNNSISVRQMELQMNGTNRIQKNILNMLCGSDKRLHDRWRFYFGSSKAMTTIIWLLWFIPFIAIKSIRASKKVYLFCFMPLAKIKNRKVYLFHLIPIAKIGEIK
jgi:glycosyltransferase involved in cell wall biosynthesis